MDYKVINRDTLPYDGMTYEFEGLQYQDTDVSFIWVEMPPEGSVRLHKHPYKEIFIIQEGQATFTIGPATLEGHAGQIIIVPSDTAHKFVNTANRPLKQVDIHISREIITQWLEE